MVRVLLAMVLVVLVTTRAERTAPRTVVALAANITRDDVRWTGGSRDGRVRTAVRCVGASISEGFTERALLMLLMQAGGADEGNRRDSSESVESCVRTPR